MNQYSSSSDDASSRLSGTAEKVVYSDSESHFTVLKLLAAERAGNLRQEVTVVGVLPGVQPGQDLEMQGKWVKDERFGRQFRVFSFRIKPPVTKKGIERYLASGLIHGVGKVMAARLVSHFGTATLEVIGESPERLQEVEGIGAQRAKDIREAWETQRSIQEVMVFLAGFGVSPSLATRIFRAYGQESIAVVRADPYRLADEVFGIGFKTADQIANAMGIAGDDPRRAAAGLLYVMGLAASAGHLYVLQQELLDNASQELDMDEHVLEGALSRLQLEQRVEVEAMGEGGEAVYLKRLHQSEVELARALHLLSMGRPPTPPGGVETVLGEVERELGITLATNQRNAIDVALTHKLVVITGGPGTGKTTIVRGIHHALRKLGKTVLLAAPTGRAARRLGEAVGAPSSTIHRMLEFSPRAQAFERNEDNPLRGDAVVVDEASMLDVPLAEAVVKAVAVGSQLILVGDVDQLPSVGPGLVLADLIASGCAAVVKLDEIFRQQQESLIVGNAHSILKGEMPGSGVSGVESDFYFIPRDEPHAVLETVRRVVLERMPRAFGWDPKKDVQILTPMRRGELGAENLNLLFQSWLNPSGLSVEKGGRTIRVGDKVMQIRNNYDKEVFNGDVGVVSRIIPDEKEVWVRFDGREMLYENNELDELVLAYAITVHKSQGSEYPVVILPLHGQHFLMLRRNLLYTAITRARSLVVVVGSEKALRMAVQRNDTRARASRLCERLQDPKLGH